MALTTAGLTNGGATTHYRFTYDDSLAAADGATRVNAVMTACEADFNLMAGWFNNIALSVFTPITVNVQPGAYGSANWSAGSSSSVINLIPGNGSSDIFTRYLLVSEVVEMLMLAQGGNNGSKWYGTSNEGSAGEGLSRFLGAQFLIVNGYGVAESGFATANSWMSSPRNDYVNYVDTTINGITPQTGCSLLFIYYLHTQLGYTATQIVAAGGPELSSVYRSLTGRLDDPFPAFRDLLNATYPGTTTIPGNNPDNPFPLAGASTGLYNQWYSLPDLYQVMVSNGDGAKKLWATEFGAPTGTNANAVSETAQATTYVGCYDQWFGWAFTGPLLWYSLRDSVANDPTNTASNFGIYHNDGTVKLAAQAFATEMAKTLPAPATPPTVPGAPTGVNATAGNASAVVRFTPPAGNVTSYSITPTAAGVAQAPTQVTSSPGTVTGLPNGSPVTFTVTATNSVGTSIASAPSAAVTPSAPTTTGPPGQPTNVSATAQDGSALIYWTPGPTGTSATTSYTITNPTGGQPGAIWTAYTSPFQIGLSNGSTYTFTVTPNNASGPGPTSASTQPVTPSGGLPTTPGVPGTVAVTPGNASAAVSWQASAAGSAPTTAYVITIYAAGIAQSTTQVASSPGTVNGLTNGTAYTATVAAINSVGTGAASPPSAVFTPSATQSTAAPVVHVAGNLLKDPSNARHVVKGAAVYMMPFYTNGTGGPDAAVANTCNDNFAQRDPIFAYMHSIGINTIRLPVGASCYGGSDPYALGGTAGYLQRIANIVTSANSAGLNVLIGCWDSLGMSANWPAQYTGSLPMMQAIVNQQAANPHCMFEPWNEPNNVTWAQWSTVMNDTLDKYRTQWGYKGVLAIDTTGWSNNFDAPSMDALLTKDAGVTGTGAANLLYSHHRYANANTTFIASGDKAEFDNNIGQHLGVYPYMFTEIGFFNNQGQPQPQWNTELVAYMASPLVANGLNGFCAFVWNWVDPNNMVNANGQQGLTSLNQWGQIATNGFFSKTLP